MKITHFEMLGYLCTNNFLLWDGNAVVSI